MTTEKTTYAPEELKRISDSFEGKEPRELIKWAIEEFFPDISLTCSFGGISGMVLLDMVMKTNKDVEVFYLDTDFLFPETYALKEEVARKYGFQPVAYKSRLTPAEQAAQYGNALWARDPDLCCELRKVEPNIMALAGKRAWITGIRRDQSKTRGEIGLVEWDTQFNNVKINAVAAWTEKDVWDYIFKNNLSYNPLHDQNYPSIGCTYCTKAVAPGADPRSGRWQGFDKDECGIQLGSESISVNVDKN
ncbi:MAG: phosphoadenylyl-sulfate reductase [Dehalococcoidia bacterium]|nr:phosphoadenylyl-sulfate reductase [Dehalococcoidia bacterium]